MARRRGLKKWDRVTVEGWLRLMGDTSVMSHLMMEIFGRLYDSTDHMDNGKSIASALHMEYRALNSAVGWAGTKIREMVEKGLVPVYPEKEKKTLAAPSLVQESLGEASLEEKASETSEAMAPWEYVFDGAEGDNGVYFWILKPEAASAYREIREAGSREIASISKILEDDETADGVEESLFSLPSDDTVRSIRRLLEKERYFQRKSFRLAHPCCVVCGADRISLLKAVPYGEKGTAERGLLFCPTHGTLFAAHLISYNSKGELLVSGRLSEEERALFHLTAGEKAHGSFVRRRMAEHRKVFNREGGKRK